MNIELLRKVQEQIMAEPKRLNMQFFIMKRENSKNYLRQWPACGTVGCIAGWTVQMSGFAYEHDSSVGVKAAALLDITFSQADRLFHVHFWPERFRNSIRIFPPQSPEYALVTKERIDYFIDTKGD